VFELNKGFVRFRAVYGRVTLPRPPCCEFYEASCQPSTGEISQRWSC